MCIRDRNVTEPGDQYEDLNETFVIFITENDVMKAGLPIYHIDRVVRETGKLFEDEEHIIYVNSQIKDETKLGRLMHDFSCTDAKDMYLSLIHISRKSFSLSSFLIMDVMVVRLRPLMAVRSSIDSPWRCSLIIASRFLFVICMVTTLSIIHI